MANAVEERHLARSNSVRFENPPHMLTLRQAALATSLVLLVVLQCIPKMDEIEVDDEPYSEHHNILINSFIIIITGLLLVSVFFEHVQEHMEHMVKGTNTAVVLEALNKEISGLGFLAIILYFIVKFQLLIKVGQALLCEPCSGSAHLLRRLGGGGGGTPAECLNATNATSGGHHRELMDVERLGVEGLGVEGLHPDLVAVASACTGVAQSAAKQLACMVRVNAEAQQEAWRRGRNQAGRVAGRRLAGDCSAVILHLFEDVHMGLFVVVLIFFARAIVLIQQLHTIFDKMKYNESQWVKNGPRTATKMLREQHASAKAEWRKINRCFHVWPFRGAVLQYRVLRQERFNLRFAALRTRFLTMSSHHGVPLAEDFPFSEYLSIRMSDLAASVVNIQPTTWVGLWIVFMFNWLIMHAPGYLQVRYYFIACCCFLISLRVVQRKLRHVVHMLLPTDVYHEIVDKAVEGGASASWGGAGKGKVAPAGNSAAMAFSLPVKKQADSKGPVTHSTVRAFKDDLKLTGVKTPEADSKEKELSEDAGKEVLEVKVQGVARQVKRKTTWLDGQPRYLIAPVPKAGEKPPLATELYQSLFWGGAAGPERLMAFFRLMMISAVVVAVLGVFMLARHAKTLMPVQLAMIILGLVMVLLAWILVPGDMLYMIVLVTSVEQLRRQSSIDRAARTHRITKNLRALKLIKSMRSETGLRKARKAAASGGIVGQGLSIAMLAKMKVTAGQAANRARAKSLLTPKQAREETERIKNEATLRHAFEMFDTNKSGALGADELYDLMTTIGVSVTHEEIAETMEMYDDDKSGMVDFTEFCCIVDSYKHDTKTEDIVAEIFADMDDDGNGELSREEFAKGLKAIPNAGLTNEDVDDLLREVDHDGDGQISYHEFSNMLTKYT